MEKRLIKKTLLLPAYACSLCLLLLLTAGIWTLATSAFAQEGNANKEIPKLKKKEIDNGRKTAPRIKKGEAKRQIVGKRIPIKGTKSPPRIKKGEAKRQYVGNRIPKKATKTLPVEEKNMGNKTEQHSIKIADPMMAPALQLYERGDYQAAASLLQQIMRQKASEPEIYEQAIRKLADCYYAIGKNGSKPHLFAAVDHYKFILQHYADPREGNDVVYHQLASSYETLKFYYEAANAWQGLLSKYPASPRGEEALFNLGEMLTKVGRYEQAGDHYRQYLAKYPQGTYIRTVAEHLADAYYQLKDYDNAALLYENIGKNYKEISEIPKVYLYRIGEAASRKGKHDETIRILSAFMSLYPRDEHTKNALYLLACAFQQLERFNTAIQIFNEIIECYPGSDESRESILKIALLGGQKRNIRVPLYLTAAAHFQDPLKAYDMLLATRPETGLEERIRFAKGEALFNQERYVEAVDEYLRLGERKQQGSYVTVIKGQLKAALLKSAEILYPRGDHVALAALYCKTGGRVVFDRNDLEGIIKIADSFHRISLDEEATRILRDAQRISPDQNFQNSIAKALENMNNKGGEQDSRRTLAAVPDSFDGLSGESLEALEKVLAAADSIEGKRWLLFEIGRRLSQEKEWAAAEKRFSQIKEGNPDSFWTKLSEYAVQETRWTERYRDFY